jgi:hypothetical protein
MNEYHWWMIVFMIAFGSLKLRRLLQCNKRNVVYWVSKRSEVKKRKIGGGVRESAKEQHPGFQRGPPP